MYIFPRCMRAIAADSNAIILDRKTGDVNGDGIADIVYIYGTRPLGTSSPFIENITLAIQDGRTNYLSIIPLKENRGYNPTIFLGDFTGDRVDDILVSIDSGGSGGFGYFYVYSFLNNTPRKLFDFETFNNYYKYDVTYRDCYKVEVTNITLRQKYIIDIRNRDREYLSEIYNPDGKLKKPLQGDVSVLSGLYPMDIQRDGIYELYALQRITGRYNADALGIVETLLSWDGREFTAFNGIQYVAVFGFPIGNKPE